MNVYLDGKEISVQGNLYFETVKLFSTPDRAPVYGIKTGKVIKPAPSYFDWAQSRKMG